MTTMTNFLFIRLNRIQLSIVLAAIFCSSLFTVALAQSNSATARPKLVIFLVADQFASNYLSLCLSKSQANGFRRLLDNGANFTACHYSSATNQTASNLAVIASGAYPWSSGIIGNQWYDRHKQKVMKATTGENAASSSDENTKPGNIHALAGTTIGDELKIATSGLSQVITVAGCDQDAILLAGKLADKSYWWDHHSGVFVSPAHFGKDLPAWAQTFNSQHNSSQYSGKTWQPLSQDSLTNQTSADYGSPSDKNFARTADNSHFIATPWANQLVIDFARQVISEESLGQHESPDMLGINFPSFEAVSKSYGDYSPESLDLVLRFDQSLADFLQFLDRKIGINNCLIVFTACRGAGQSPDFLRAHEMEANTVDAKTFREQLNSALCSRLGNANWIEAFEPPNIYFNLNTIDHSNYHQPDIEKMASKLGRSIPGTAEIYGAFQFFMNEVPSGPLTEAVRKSYFWGRSGELYVIPKPGFAYMSEIDGTSSGSPYNYDTQVPLIFSGGGVKPGTYATPADPDDIAPTTANILGICSPALAEGHVLSEGLSSRERARFK
jgi:predicted AlkP superfamily pyrophosphatase or phosphodiesterase